MTDQSPRPTLSPQSQTLDKEIHQISQLANQTYQIFQQNKIPLPPQAVENLNLLNSYLLRLGQRAKTWQEEQNNLFALTQVSQVINSSLDLDQVLRIVMDTLVGLTGSERGFLMLRDDQGQLITRIARNWEQASIDSPDGLVSRTIINRVVSEGQPILTTNAQEDPRFGDKESIILHNLRSIMCVPLKVKDELTGVIYADNRFQSGIFSESNLNLLATFANQAAIAIENARLFDSVRRTLAEVTELKNLMDNVFASIASGVITTDLENSITLSNRAAENILGVKPQGLVGQSVQKLLSQSPDGLPEFEENITNVMETGNHVIGVELRPNLNERGSVILSINLSPLKDASETTQGVAIVLEDLTEQRRLQAQRRLFERMVSPAVINQLNPDRLQLGGKRAYITALFADIRGYTSFSEKMDPEMLVAILNRYVAAAADAVLAHEGTIDKFMGDAVMAWYNAPIPQPDHAMRAVLTALDIRKGVLDLQAVLPPENHLSFGIGIHFGEAVLGLVGTEKRLEYTAIGDSVNIAKRIQENSAANQILISASAYTLVSNQVEAIQVEAVRAKGKSVPIDVYEVVGLK